MTIRIVAVRFPGTPYKDYAYFTTMVLKKGDWVVCDSANGLGLARVVNTRPSADAKMRARAWLLTKIDVDSLRAGLPKHEKGYKAPESKPWQ